MELNSSENETKSQEISNKSVADFKEVVNESREKIASEKPKPPKSTGRRVGRPPNHDKSPKGPRQRPKSPTEPGAGDGQSTAPGGQAPVHGQALDVSQYLVPPLMMVSKIPANKYRIAELALTPQEAADVAVSLNNLLNAFIPDGQIDPKTAAILTFGVTAGGLFLQKYQIYSAKYHQPPECVPVEEIRKQTEPERTIPVENYFQRPQ